MVGGSTSEESKGMTFKARHIGACRQQDDIQGREQSDMTIITVRTAAVSKEGSL